MRPASGPRNSTGRAAGSPRMAPVAPSAASRTASPRPGSRSAPSPRPGSRPSSSPGSTGRSLAGPGPGSSSGRSSTGRQATTKSTGPLPSCPSTTADASRFQSALDELFEAYDTNGNGTIDIEEFVEAQTILGTARKLDIDKNAIVSDFFELFMTRAVGIVEFSDWQATSLASQELTQEEMEAQVFWCTEHLRKARSSSSSLAAGAAGAGSSAARHLRDSPSKAVGHASASKGFVEDAKAVNADLDSFEKALSLYKDAGDSSDEERGLVRIEVEALSTDAQMAKLARELRELRRKRRAAATAKDAQNLRQQEKNKLKQLRDLFHRRQKERHGKLTLQGTTNSKGKHIDGANLELSRSNLSIASTKSDKTGSFEIRTEAKLGQSMALVAQKDGFAKSTKRVGGDGVRHMRIELLPLIIKERFEAKPGSKDSAVFQDKESGAQFDVPVGEITKDGGPYAGEVDFRAGVVDLNSQLGIESMPPLAGRAVDGTLTPMNSLGCVYVEMLDPSDGTGLGLKHEGSGIDANLVSSAPLPPNPPSVWHYDETAGEWEQTFQNVSVNGSELALPKDDKIPPDAEELAEQKVEEQQAAAEEDLQKNRQMLDEQRQKAKEPKICTCGFEAKRAIMPLVCESAELSLADPPKRVFASTETRASGELSLAFPYLSEDERKLGAEKASRLPEVVLSHHLSRAAEVLGTPWEAWSCKASVFYEKGAQEALDSLRIIADWMLEHAEATSTETGEPAEDVDPMFMQLKVLEKLSGLWARGDFDPSVHSAGPTLCELRMALEDFSGDIPAALLKVARDQARRSEVAKVRQILRDEDERMTAKFRVVDRALDEANGVVEDAAEAVKKDPNVNKYLVKLKTREELYKKMPMAHPTSKQVEQAMEQADGDPEKAAALLEEMPAVQEKAKEVYKTWTETLEEAKETNNFNFQILDTGWNNVDVAESSPPVTDPAPVCYRDPPNLEFFPPAPRPLCPVGDSSMVLGAFDDGVFAAQATSVGITYKGVDYAEEVQPDGTFSLIALGRTQFEVKTTKADGTQSFGFGPFFAQARGQITHLGLLSPPRDDAPDAAMHLGAGKIDVSLPTLEFPPHGSKSLELRWQNWLGTWEWSWIQSGIDATVKQMYEHELIPIDEAPRFTLELLPDESGLQMRMRGTDDPDGRAQRVMIRGTGRPGLNEDGGMFLTIILDDSLPRLTEYKFEFDMAEDFWKVQRVRVDRCDVIFWAKRIKGPSGERCTCFGEVDEEEPFEGEFDEDYDAQY